MKILITGSTCQIGIELLKQFQLFRINKKFELISPSSNDLDLSSIEKCGNFVKELVPDILIKLATYTAVEKA